MRRIPPRWFAPRGVKVTGEDIGIGCGCLIAIPALIAFLYVTAMLFGKVGAFLACLIAAPILLYFGTKRD